MENRKRQIAIESGRHNKVIKRPFPINPSNHVPVDDIFFKWDSTSPWDHYRRETTLGPGSNLAFLKKYPHGVVLIRKVDKPARGTASLKSTIHRNLVQLHRVYIEKSSISMVYEITVASLSDLLSFRPHWAHAETAAVCHGVLSALKYLHSTLHIAHGDLREENIRLDWNGTIKLGALEILVA